MRVNPHKNTKEDYKRAHQLRNDASFYERKLWDAIRSMATARKLKFRRQQVIHPFIADFACMEARLLIELDGFSHDARQAYDAKREHSLKTRGFHILRFQNEDVVKNIEGVISVIFDTAECLIQKRYMSPSVSPLPNPPHKGEGTIVPLHK